MVQKFKVNTQPYYTLLDTEGLLLSAPKGYNLKVGHFIDFLDNGLSEFFNRYAKKITANAKG